MRVLALGDLHGRYKHIPALISACQPLDLVLLAGDITHFGPVEAVREIFNLVKHPLLAIAGNCDPTGIIEVLEEYDASLNDAARNFKDVFLMGIGGSNITPFNTPFERCEEEIEETISQLQRKHSIKKPSVLLTHCPPLGYCDLTHQGIHAGSSAIRNTASCFDVVICAHIHEARGIEYLNRTMIVNPGTASRGYGALIKIDRDIKVELITA